MVDTDSASISNQQDLGNISIDFLELLLLTLLLLLLLLQEPTDIPSRKKLMRCVCARRGSLL